MTFDPASLFAAAQAGAWFDPSDLSTLWQDTGAIAPVTSAGQAVARIDDRSGNGNHLVQATAAARPLYQVDSNGKAYLLFDGIDDWLGVAFGASMSMPWDRITAIRQVGWTLNRRIFGNRSGGGTGQVLQSGTTPRIRLSDGTAGPENAGLAVGANGVVTERHISGASQLAINNQGYVTGNSGSTATNGLVVGGGAGGTNLSNIRFYGGVIRAGTMTDEEIANLRAWLAEKSGVTFVTRRAARHSWWS